MLPEHNPDPNAPENRHTYSRHVITDEEHGLIGQGVEVVLEILNHHPNSERKLHIQQRIRPGNENPTWFQRWHTGSVYLTPAEVEAIYKLLPGAAVGKLTREVIIISGGRDQLYSELRQESRLLQRMALSPVQANIGYKEYRKQREHQADPTSAGKLLQNMAAIILTELADRNVTE